jgi:hypothetical protein
VAEELDVVVVVDVLIDADELEQDVAVVALDMDVDIVDDVVLVAVTDAWHAPVIDGTESTPTPMGTKLVPQLAEFARRRF